MFTRISTGAALITCIVLGARQPAPASEKHPAPPMARCPSGGSSGGSFTVSPRVAGAFVISFDTAGIRLDAAMLLRGQRGWERDATGRTGAWPPLVPRQPGDHPPNLSGATVDTFAVVYDRANDVAWIGGQRVPMDGANVVLIDRADGVGGPPIVLERRRVGPRVPMTDTTCTIADPRRAAEIAALLTTDPAVRAFVER